VRNGYDTDGLLINSSVVKDTTASDQAITQGLTIANDLVNFGKLLGGDQPDLVKLVSGAVLLNRFMEPGGQSTQFPSFGTAANVGAGALSLYNLSEAFKNGDALDKVGATLNTLNYANQALLASGAGNAALSGVLNGSGAGLVGGSVGVLPVIGLITAIKSEDPIGIATSLVALYNPALYTTPVGWAILAANILRVVFADAPDDAWGTGNVTWGPEFNDLSTIINATGESFGPDRVRTQLQNAVNTLQAIATQTNSNQPDANLHLGIIPNRLPVLGWRANEFDNPGSSVTDIDRYSGVQRLPNLRFDDNGRFFNIDIADVTPELRSLLSVEGAPIDFRQIDAYMLYSANQRNALAPMWEVRTAKMQSQAGDPNAGLTEEERAACYEISSWLRTTNNGWRHISFIASPETAANQAYWREVA